MKLTDLTKQDIEDAIKYCDIEIERRRKDVKSIPKELKTECLENLFLLRIDKMVISERRFREDPGLEGIYVGQVKKYAEAYRER